jgi:hypothetical protein
MSGCLATAITVAADLAANPATSAAETGRRLGLSGSRALGLLRELSRHGVARPFHVGPGRSPVKAYRWWPSVAAQVAGPFPASPSVMELIDLAAAGGLRPHVDGTTYRRSYRVFLDGSGRSAPFGSLKVSAAKGTLLSANLMWGNAAPDEQKYGSVAETRTALGSWLAIMWGRR